MVSDKMTVNVKLMSTMPLPSVATIQGHPFPEQFTRNDWMRDQFGALWLVTDVQEAYIDVKSHETMEVKRVTGLTYNDQGGAIFEGETVLPAVTQRNGITPTKLDKRLAETIADRDLVAWHRLRADLAMTEDEYARNRKIWIEGQWDLNIAPHPDAFDSPENFAPSESKVFDKMTGIKAGMRERIADHVHKLLNADPVIGVQTRTEVNEDDEQEATERLAVLLAMKSK